MCMTKTSHKCTIFKWFDQMFKSLYIYDWSLLYSDPVVIVLILSCGPSWSVILPGQCRVPSDCRFERALGYVGHFCPDATIRDWSHGRLPSQQVHQKRLKDVHQNDRRLAAIEASAGFIWFFWFPFIFVLLIIRDWYNQLS